MKKGIKRFLGIMDVLAEHDRESYEHCGRVSEIACMIAKASRKSISSSLLEKIKYGALFHDAGKISMPAHVLNKKETLSDEEFYLIKQHAWIGYELSRAIDLHPDISEIIHSHHEAWDGSGYPRGLKGSEISPATGICMVADCLDAMVSERTYKIRKTYDEAVSLINMLSAVKFDPAAVESFNSIRGEVLSFYNSGLFKNPLK